MLYAACPGLKTRCRNGCEQVLDKTRWSSLTGEQRCPRHWGQTVPRKICLGHAFGTLLCGECIPITCAAVYEFDSWLLHFVFSNCSNSEVAHRFIFNF